MENFFLSHICDYGFFGLKYVENYDGKSMREFKQVHIFNFFVLSFCYNLLSLFSILMQHKNN